MLLPKDIITESNPTLRLIATEVSIPLSRKEKEKGKEMLKYLKTSQDDELAKKYNMVAGVGLAAPQINISKRFFACMFFDGEKEYEFVIYNPIFLSKSKEMVYLSTGEGCLSIPGVSGKVLRHKTVKVKGTILNNKDGSIEEKEMVLNDYASIVFQHEYDHLDGILFTDKLTNDELEKYEAV